MAAATLKGTEGETPIHWRAASNSAWQWYERETLIDGRWTLTGITTPIHRETGEPYTEKKGYLDESLVPAEMRVWNPEAGDRDADADDGTVEATEHRPYPGGVPATGGLPANGCAVCTPMNYASG